MYQPHQAVDLPGSLRQKLHSSGSNRNPESHAPGGLNENHDFTSIDLKKRGIVASPRRYSAGGPLR
jgi:hypothetical protein